MTIKLWSGSGRVPAVFAMTLGAVFAPVTVALADHGAYMSPENKLGFSACGWPAGRAATVAIDRAFPFPDSSYADRLDEAVRRWDAALSTSSRGGGMVRVPDGPADVMVRYRALDGAGDDVLAETYLQRDRDADLSPNIGRCPDRQAITHHLKGVEIRISPRSDWFRGPDSATATWQRCAEEGFRFTNVGLCADQADFASTVMHELGHALVIYHPQTLDEIDGVAADHSDSASRHARCVETTGSFEAQATMCSGQGTWRAEQRTLETWDIETLHRHHAS
jgi:hypothetical protein